MLSLLFRKAHPPRRAGIRKNRPDSPTRRLEQLRASGVPTSLGIAAVFALVAIAILMLREEVVPYRPGEQVHHDVVSRVSFTFRNKERLADAQQRARESVPRVYRQNGDLWTEVEQSLLALPDRVATAARLEDLHPDLQEVLDAASFTRLKELGSDRTRPNYVRMVRSYIDEIRAIDPVHPESGLFILPAEGRAEDLRRGMVQIQTADPSISYKVSAERTYTTDMTPSLDTRLFRAVQDAPVGVDLTLQPKFVAYTIQLLRPTHELDETATVQAQNRAEAEVPKDAGNVIYAQNQPIVKAGMIIDDRHWQVLRAEHQAFLESLDQNLWKSRLGGAAVVLLITVALCGYIAMFEPRIIRKHPRAIAIAALLLSMLLVAQLAALGSSPIYFFAVVPTILVAMIVTIAYNQRFALGVGLLHAALVTVGVGEGLSFMLVLVAGVMMCCFLLDDIRTRSKLIEVGGATALAMMAASGAAGLMSLHPLKFMAMSALYTGAAGLTAGLIALAILDFIERTFRITTSMRLLELADPSHPLLKRLQLEAHGTYNHSLQVATIAEAAADAIGANSLLCRVASYYHDAGKINKAEYFIENQVDGENRHINLSPSVSLLIIIGHVKDGIELAKEYGLPTSLFPFIQTHHGTTVVEYFYHRAVTSADAKDAPAISENQYRYPGPKPKSQECAIVMIADACESATRAMSDPTANRIEALVHDLIMKRLLDGQFDDCELTMNELQQVERACVRTLAGIYHGRIAYPSQTSLPAPSAAPLTVKTA